LLLVNLSVLLVNSRWCALQLNQFIHINKIEDKVLISYNKQLFLDVHDFDNMFISQSLFYFFNDWFGLSSEAIFLYVSAVDEQGLALPCDINSKLTLKRLTIFRKLPQHHSGSMLAEELEN